MHFRNCPLRAQIGCAACRARGELTDRRGVKFPVECGEKKYSTLLNSVPLHIADKDLRGLDHCILWFTRESAAECAAVAADYRAGRKSSGSAPADCTTGSFCDRRIKGGTTYGDRSGIFCSTESASTSFPRRKSWIRS